MAETINASGGKRFMAKITSVAWKNSYWDFHMEVYGKSHEIFCRKDDENASVLRCDFQTKKPLSVVVANCINTICHYMHVSPFKEVAFSFEGKNIVTDIHCPNFDAILS